MGTSRGGVGQLVSGADIATDGRIPSGKSEAGKLESDISGMRLRRMRKV
jgi:hypothetical protein